MQYSKQERKQLKNILYDIFPDVDSYPVNSMTPGLSTSADGIKVNMLILGESEHLEDFVSSSDQVRVKITVRAEENKILGNDLVMHFDFKYPTGQPYFETVIYGVNPESQKAFIEALQKVDHLYIWVINENRDPLKVMTVDWDYNSMRDTLDPFLYN